jgi:NAD(P)-dependent dehydrogenase (short-subunit alcohol dehydrogenase family)
MTRSVLVTGASKGIGRATVLRLSAAGWKVFAGVRRDEDGLALRNESAGVVPVRLDVGDDDQIATAVERIASEAGGALGAVVNNAGIAVAGPLEFLPIAELRRQLEVNVVGQIAVTQAVLPLLRSATGRIVFVSSIAGRSAMPFTGAYSASKFALEALADALRVELQPWDIHVSVIEPGVIATPIWETAARAADRILADAPPALQSFYGERLEALRRRAARGMEGLPPDTVAAAVEHALTASPPKTRYVIGRDAHTRLWLERVLPDRARDRVIDWAFRRM